VDGTHLPTNKRVVDVNNLGHKQTTALEANTLSEAPGIYQILRNTNTHCRPLFVPTNARKLF